MKPPQKRSSYSWFGHGHWARVLGGALPARRRNAGDPLATVPKPVQTLALIQRHEALRARGRPPFSVIVVDVGDSSPGQPSPLRLLQAFQGRARLGDEIGWIAANRIALILPLTDRDGARCFAEQICGQLLSGDGPPRFEIFTE